MKLAIGIGLGVAVGALVGWSGLLCPDGSCAVTGTPYGGGFLGGLLGLALASSMDSFKTPKPDSTDDSPNSSDVQN